ERQNWKVLRGRTRVTERLHTFTPEVPRRRYSRRLVFELLTISGSGPRDPIEEMSDSPRGQLHPIGKPCRSSSQSGFSKAPASLWELFLHSAAWGELQGVP